MTVRADNRLADAPMTSVRCGRCAAEVSVRKSSWSQTSVQWNAAAMAGCPQRADAQRLAIHEGRGFFLACSALDDSIIDAVRRGQVTVVDEVASSTK
jgi:hypothetical protein